MKRVIHGKKLELTTGGDNLFAEVLSKYWTRENAFPRNSQFHDSIKENAVYYSPRNIIYPNPVIVEKMEVDFRLNDAHIFYSASKASNDLSEKCIAIRPNSTRYFQAYFFLEKKTLVLNDNLPATFIAAICEKLAEAGHIFPTFSNEEKQFIAELHNGVSEIILAPKKTKFVTVGADPEFEVLRSGQVIRPPEGYRGTSSEIGLDGAGSQIELRPRAGTPDEVIENLKQLFLKLNDPISTLGNSYPLGGHIHVGVGHSFNPGKDLLYLLDYFLGKPTINLSGRARNSYKQLSACETKRWGFEYRTPPAAIFHNPTFTKLALKICKELTECYINGQDIKITLPYPTKEDYLNYCGFTDDDYEKWVENLISYEEEFMGDATKALKFNISHCWDESIRESTSAGLCTNAQWKTGKCSYQGCMTCYPTTAPGWLQAQADARRIAEEARIAQRKPVPTEQTPQPNPSEARRNTALLRLSDKGIHLSDTWPTNAVQIVARIADEIDYNSSEQIELYGLSESRGACTAGFDVEGLLRLTDIPGHSSRNHFGFPFCMRNEPYRDFTNRGFMLGDLVSVALNSVLERGRNTNTETSADTAETVPNTAMDEIREATAAVVEPDIAAVDEQNEGVFYPEQDDDPEF